MSKKFILRVFINIIIGVVLTAVWIRFVNIEQIFRSLSIVNPVTAILMILLIVLGQVFRAVRLNILLSKYIAVRALDLMLLNGVAQLLNFLIPIRAGEISKAVYLNQSYQLPLAKSLAWIFIDRLIDFIFVILAAGILLILIPTSLSISFGYSLVFGGIVIFIIVYLMSYQQKSAESLFKFIEACLIFDLLRKYFSQTYQFFISTIGILKLSVSQFGQILICTILAYLSEAMVLYIAFIGLGRVVPVLNMYLAQLLSALTYLVPAAPGYIGSAEVSGLLVLSGVLGYSRNLASSVTILFHVCALIAVLGYGLIGIYGLKVDALGLFKKALRRE